MPCLALKGVIEAEQGPLEVRACKEEDRKLELWALAEEQHGQEQQGLQGEQRNESKVPACRGPVRLRCPGVERQ